MSCQQASRLILVLDHVLRLSWLPVSFSSWVQNSDWLVIDWLIVWLPQGAFRRLLDPIRPRGILRPHLGASFGRIARCPMLNAPVNVDKDVFFHSYTLYTCGWLLVFRVCSLALVFHHCCSLGQKYVGTASLIWFLATFHQVVSF